jgi:hypothetical protein
MKNVLLFAIISGVIAAIVIAYAGNENEMQMN